LSQAFGLPARRVRRPIRGKKGTCYFFASLQTEFRSHPERGPRSRPRRDSGRPERGRRAEPQTQGSSGDIELNWLDSRGEKGDMLTFSEAISGEGNFRPPAVRRPFCTLHSAFCTFFPHPSLAVGASQTRPPLAPPQLLSPSVPQSLAFPHSRLSQFTRRGGRSLPRRAGVEGCAIPAPETREKSY